jgi:hypothetical protein
MDNGWLAREVERTEKIIDAIPGGWEAVQEARRRAEEENRAESEAYREQLRLRETKRT